MHPVLYVLYCNVMFCTEMYCNVKSCNVLYWGISRDCSLQSVASSVVVEGVDVVFNIASGRQEDNPGVS